MRIEEQIIDLKRLILSATKKALTVDECAVYLGITSSRLRHMISDKELPYYKHHGRIFFDREELERTLLSERYMTQREIDNEAEKLKN